MTKNIWLKIASVLLALTLWVFVMSKGRTEVLMEVPLIFRDVPVGLQVKEANNMNVTVHLRGAESAVTAVKSGDIKAYVTLSDARSGVNAINISPSDIKSPPEVSVVMVNPSQVKVELEAVLKKTLPVDAVVTGEPIPGYEVTSVVVTPAKVEIEGPQSVVKPMKEIKARPVDITLASGSVAERVALDIPAEGVKTSVRNVRVIVRIAKKETGR